MSRLDPDLCVRCGGTYPGDQVCDTCRTAVAAAQAELDDLASAEGLTVREKLLMREPVARRLAEAEARRDAALAPEALSPFSRGRPAAQVWEDLDIFQRRAVVRRLMRIVVHKAPKGRPPGWRVGEPYFHEQSIEFIPNDI